MNKEFVIGDKVEVLDDAVKGTVIGFKKDQIVIETSDGFPLNYNPSELIKIKDESMRFFADISLDQVLRDKKDPEKRSFTKDKKSKKEPFSIPYDLHIEKLVKNFKNMSNHDILTLQMDTARYHLEHAIKNRIPRIVFIHGVGEGILKSELDFMLSRYGSTVTFEDANYQKYGSGATQVYIKQNA